ncbi:MAG: hypothetical protein ACRD2W_07560, partial [Acidimicrobiales bacterium]
MPRAQSGESSIISWQRRRRCALCRNPRNAHILRSLNELLANHRHQHWAKAFIELIVDTKHRVDAARAAG